MTPDPIFLKIFSRRWALPGPGKFPVQPETHAAAVAPTISLTTSHDDRDKMMAATQ
jgi:hypothetical protein